MFKDMGVLLYVCDGEDAEVSAAPSPWPAVTPTEKPKRWNTQIESAPSGAGNLGGAAAAT